MPEKQAEKRGRGRPPTYQPEFADLARKFCLLGATNQDLARLFDVSDTSIDNWIRDIPEFVGAVKEGRELADARVATSLYHRALGYSHPEEKPFLSDGEIITYEGVKHYPPDTAAAFIWLKNRQPDKWRDRKEITGENGEAIQVEVTTK